MRILIADKLAAFVPSRLEEIGAQVTVATDLGTNELTAKLATLDPEVLVVRSTRVTAHDLAAAPGLSLVIRAGAGVNTIDLGAASARGVYVTNCPGKNANAVAELTIGHLVNLDRRIADNVAALREGRWNKKGFSKARGLSGRRLAVLGLGMIGREVVVRAQALGMKVVAWSRRDDAPHAEALGIDFVDTPEDAVRGADAVTVHLALTTGTRGRIGRSVFEAMRTESYFVNTSRAEVVDEGALLDAVRTRGIRAGLDVFAAEPSGGTGEVTSALASEPNVYVTHHIGASTIEAEEGVGEEVVRIVTAYARRQTIPNCVNLATESHATHVLVVRHADRVGVLAHVLDVLRKAGHNVQEMQNIVFSGGEAACARIALVGAPDPETLRAIASGEHVFAVSAATVEQAREGG